MSPADQSRDAIIAAASKLFVEKGFAGTSMSMVAREAEVTQSLIHYHFKTKQDLWTEIKVGMFDQYSRQQQDLFSRMHASDPEGFKEAIAVYFRFLKENPDFVRLSLWRALERVDTEQADCAEMGESLFAQGAAYVVKAQAEGKMRSDVPGLHMIIAFLSAATHWFVEREDFSKLFPEMDHEQAGEAFLENLQKIIMEGILPR